MLSSGWSKILTDCDSGPSAESGGVAGNSGADMVVPTFPSAWLLDPPSRVPPTETAPSLGSVQDQLDGRRVFRTPRRRRAARIDFRANTRWEFSPTIAHLF